MRIAQFIVLNFLCQTLIGQFEYGAGGGVYHGDMWKVDFMPVRPDKGPSFTAALYFRDRSNPVANFFAELAWVRRDFSVHFDDIWPGGGVRTDLDVKLDHLYLTLGPEFGNAKGTLTFRSGTQIGRFLGGTANGISNRWSMYSGPNEVQSATGRARDYFCGDIRWFTALRVSVRAWKKFSLTLEPFMSVSVSPMSWAQSSVRSLDSGLRIGVLRGAERTKSRERFRSFWKRLRAGSPNAKPGPVEDQRE